MQSWGVELWPPFALYLYHEGVHGSRHYSGSIDHLSHVCPGCLCVWRKPRLLPDCPLFRLLSSALLRSHIPRPSETSVSRCLSAPAPFLFKNSCGAKKHGRMGIVAAHVGCSRSFRSKIHQPRRLCHGQSVHLRPQAKYKGCRFLWLPLRRWKTFISGYPAA